MKQQQHVVGESLLDLARRQLISRQVLQQRYAQGSERSLDDVYRRVACAIAKVERPETRSQWETIFLQSFRRGFIPAGRIQAVAGTRLHRCMINCFVQPIQTQSESNHEGLAPRPFLIQQAIETMRMGGGVGYDFSGLRQADAAQAFTEEVPFDPIGVIRKLDQQALSLTSRGLRRAAQMAVLSIEHPDIERFVDAKRDLELPTFNLSVSIPDRFMEAVRNDATWRLRNPVNRRVVKAIQARKLWDSLLRAIYDTASPGVIFIDQVNRDNNLSDIETLNACNPCGEQYLPEYGACDLGSIDLPRLVSRPFSTAAAFQFGVLHELVGLAVRALDNVLDLTRWPLKEQAHEAAEKRRIGIGVTGLADALCMLGLRYDRSEGRTMARRIAMTLRNGAYLASAELARERGSFPRFEARAVLRAPHAASRLPSFIKARIEKNGLRNSHLLAIAPAGSISIAFAGNASSGIEPIFAAHTMRRLRGSAGRYHLLPADDLAWRLYRLIRPQDSGRPPAWCEVKTMRAIDHIRMLIAVQPFIDGAISKTVNLSESESMEALEAALRLAWQRGLKGLSFFRPLAAKEAVLCATG